MRNLTIERTTVVILFVLLFAIATRVPADTDTWWHIRSGEYMLAQGMIHGDPFSHTKAGETWINHSWGAQLVLYATYSSLGNAGLALFQAVLAVGGLAVLYRAGTGNAYLRGLVLILGAAAASVFWSARPQMISFFGNCLIMLLIYDFKRGKDRLWLIPVLMLIWGNMHAGYSIGFIFLGAAIVGETLNILTGNGSVAWSHIGKLVGITLISGAVLLINPYGLDMLLVPFQTVGIESLRAYIQEWNSPNFQGRETWAFIGLVIAIIGAAWGSRLKFDWTGFFLLGGTLFLALLYGRNIAVFAVAALPILMQHLDNILTTRGWVLPTRTRSAPLQARLNALLIGVVAVGVFAYLVGVLSPKTISDVQANILPVQAVAYLNANPQSGRMFNSYNWGGYLMFAAPQYPVFIDGRTDLYGEFLDVYLDTALARATWRETLADYAIGLVIVEKNSGLDIALRSEPDWRLIYEDELAVMHVR
jgi:hypothetical protein